MRKTEPKESGGTNPYRKNPKAFSRSGEETIQSRKKRKTLARRPLVRLLAQRRGRRQQLNWVGWVDRNYDRLFSLLIFLVDLSPIPPRAGLKNRGRKKYRGRWQRRLRRGARLNEVEDERRAGEGLKIG